MLSNKGVNYKSDIYQIGLILYDIYSGKIAFKNNNLKIIYDNIKNNRNYNNNNINNEKNLKYY